MLAFPRRLLLSICLLLASFSLASAATVSLAWDASPSPAVTGYRLDYGTGPGAPTVYIDVGNQLAVSLTLADGQVYYVTVRAYDASGALSPPSNEIVVSTLLPPPPSGGTGRVNVALASQGGVATASSSYGPGHAPSGAINGDRRGAPWGGGAGWNDATGYAFPDWLEVAFSGAQTIDEVDVFGLQDAYDNPSDPTATLTFTRYGLIDFTVQYWTGTAWQAVPGGVIRGNTLVWRKLTFAPVTTSRIRVLVEYGAVGCSRIIEVEAYAATGGSVPNTSPLVTLTSPTTAATFTAPATVTLAATASDPDGTIRDVTFYANGTAIGTDTISPYSGTWSSVPAGSYTITAVATDAEGASTTSAAAPITVSASGPPPGRVNVALASQGGVATASSSYGPGHAPSGAINGDRRGAPWGGGAGWNDATGYAFPDWLEVAFSGAQTIDEVDVFGLQDAYDNPSDPTATLTFTRYGLIDFTVQYWTGTAWQAVPGGVIRGNTLVWRKLTFAPVTTSRIRVLVEYGAVGCSRIIEVEAYAATGGSVPAS